MPQIQGAISVKKFFYIMNDTKIILFTWHSEKNQSSPFHHLFFYAFAPKFQSWTGTQRRHHVPSDFRDSPELSSLAAFSHAGKAAVSTDCYRRWAPPCVYWYAHLPSRAHLWTLEGEDFQWIYTGSLFCLRILLAFYPSLLP